MVYLKTGVNVIVAPESIFQATGVVWQLRLDKNDKQQPTKTVTLQSFNLEKYASWSVELVSPALEDLPLGLVAFTAGEYNGTFLADGVTSWTALIRVEGVNQKSNYKTI